MTTEQAMVRDFHVKFGSPLNDTPISKEDLSPFLALLRSRLIVSEASEFLECASQNDMEGMIDALCDILYVTYGTGVAFGIDLEPIFAEVHRSNMTKTPQLDSGGKVMKGDNWEPPDIKGQLKDQGWDE